MAARELTWVSMVLWGLGGCFEPAAKEGLTCAVDGSCPSGQECRSQTNLCFAVDNPICVPGATPHDEDGDGVDDSCDNCPGVENPTQADSELSPDGVGDACDPRPDGEGDRLLSFDAFAGQLSDWTADNATLAADAVRIEGDGSLATSLARGNAALEVRLSDVSAMGTGDVGVEARAGMDAYRCLYRAADDGQLRLEAGGATEVDDTPGTQERPRRLVLSWDTSPAQQCNFQGEDGASLSSNAASFVSDEVFVVGDGVGALIEYVAIYELGGPL